MRMLRLTISRLFACIARSTTRSVIDIRMIHSRLILILLWSIQWAKPLGLPSNLGFQDLYSLDPDFLQYTPKPVYAVLLLFPSRGKLFEARAEEDQMEEYKWKGKNKENGIWWIKQTVS